MKVGIDSGKVILCPDPEDKVLQPRHKSQLSFWGFLYNHASNCYETSSYSNDSLLKLIDYLKTQNVKLSLDNRILSLLKDVQKGVNEFDLVMDWGKRFKSGEIPVTKNDKFIRLY